MVKLLIIPVGVVWMQLILDKWEAFKTAIIQGEGQLFLCKGKELHLYETIVWYI